MRTAEHRAVPFVSARRLCYSSTFTNVCCTMACWFGSAHVTCTSFLGIASSLPSLPHEAVYCIPQNSEALTPWCQRCAAAGGPCYHKGPSTPHDTLSRKGALCRSLQALSFSSGRDPHGESLICGGQPNCRKDLLIMIIEISVLSLRWGQGHLPHPCHVLAPKPTSKGFRRYSARCIFVERSKH